MLDKMLEFPIIAIFCIQLSRCQVSKESTLKVVHGASKDYKTYGLADDLLLVNTEKLADTITKCCDLTDEKCKLFPSDCAKWRGSNDNFLNGITLLVKGCQTKNTRAYLMGVMNLASSLISVRRVQGHLMTQMVEAVVLTFKLYGDPSSGIGIDPMRNALQDFRMTELELDFQGTKEYLELMLNPIPLNPEIPKPVKTLKEKEKIQERFTGYTEGEVKEILQKAQKQINMYWKLSTLISNYCHNRAIDEEVAGSNTLTKCLHVMKLYSELAQTHIAYFLKIIVKIKMSPDVPSNLDYTGKLLYFCERRFEKDNTTLNFLFNPMTSFDKTKVIFELYNNADQNKEVIEHLLLLHNKYSLYKKDRVVICKEERLFGLCRELRAQKEPPVVVNMNAKWEELIHWVNTKSIFIPPGIEVHFTSNGEDQYKNEPSIIHGPFKGLAVYSNDERLNMGDFIVSPSSDSHVTPEVRICTVDGWCDSLVDDTTYARDVHGVDLTSESLKTIDVPDGLAVKLFTEDGKMVPFVGPFTATDLHLCPGWSWHKIEQFRRDVPPPLFDSAALKRTIVRDKRNIVSRKRNIVGNKRKFVGNKRNIVGNKMKVVGNKRNIVGNKTDGVGNKTNIVGNKTDDVANKTNVVSEKMNNVGNKTDAVGNKTDAVGNKTNGVGNKTNIVGNRTNIVGNKTNVVGNKTNIIGNKTNAVVVKTNIIGDKTKIIGDKMNIIDVKVDIVGDQANIVGNIVNIVGDKANIVGDIVNIVGDKANIVDNKMNIVGDQTNRTITLDNRNTTAAWGKDIADERADQKVVVCTKPYMKGYCMQYGSSFVNSNIYTPMSGIIQPDCRLAMQSMSIPAGTKINGFQYIEGKKSVFGPYFGPITLDKIEDIAKYEVEVINLFKVGEGAESPDVDDEKMNSTKMRGIKKKKVVNKLLLAGSMKNKSKTVFDKKSSCINNIKNNNMKYCNRNTGNIQPLFTDTTTEKINKVFQRMFCNYVTICNKTTDQIKAVKKNILSNSSRKKVIILHEE